MFKLENDLSYFDVQGGGGTSVLPVQHLPSNKKTLKWKKATVDAIERYGERMYIDNRKFVEYRKMKDGHYSYISSDFVRQNHSDHEMISEISSGQEWIRHYDFIGMVVNAITSVYREVEDRYTVKSIDEYSTNEFIRYKTEIMHKNAEVIFWEEVNRMLLMRGMDLNKSDFSNEEEAQAYQQEIQQQVQSLTPKEIEDFMAKNFKVIAVEWAQNTLTEDSDRYKLADKMDFEQFIDYLLTGRYFRHYRIKYDTYSIERWRPEDVFFSQEVDTEYPQKNEMVGRIRFMTVSSILNEYSDRLTPNMTKQLAKYWGDENDHNNYTNYTSSPYHTKNYKKALLPELEITPFHNYYDHKINESFEDALGIPLGEETIIDEDGEEKTFRVNLPRMEPNYGSAGLMRSRDLRSDIIVRRDSVQVTEGYWRSYKRMALVIFRNEAGELEVYITDDSLLPEVKQHYNLKELKDRSLSSLKRSISENNLEEYENTLFYFFVPEIWRFIKIKGNGISVKDDLYLDIEPLEFQIRAGDSDLIDFCIPVSGLVSQGIMPKIIDYQIGHNIMMNGVYELTRKELGVVFALDVNAIPSEYRDEGTIDSLNHVWSVARDTGFMPLNPGIQNAEGNRPNVFQRQDLSFTDNITAKWNFAKAYRQAAFEQLGITPEILGAPNAYATAEGVKQGVRASYALMSPYIEEFNSSKVEGMNLHLSFAQHCQVNGVDNSVMYRKSDGEINYLNILEEDGELFPLRRLGIIAETNVKDRSIVETIRNFVLNNNTIIDDIDDVITILTNPVLTELKQITAKNKADKILKEQESNRQRQEEFDKTLAAQQESIERRYAHEENIERIRGEYDIQEQYVKATGMAADNNAEQFAFDNIDKAKKTALQEQQQANQFENEQMDLNLKRESSVEANKIKLMELGLKAKEISTRLEIQKSKEKTATTPKIVNIN